MHDDDQMVMMMMMMMVIMLNTCGEVQAGIGLGGWDEIENGSIPCGFSSYASCGFSFINCSKVLKCCPAVS